MKITFEGNKKVIADFNGRRIVTDQPVRAGGDGSAPAPFDLFLASLGTCAGIYVKSFCDQRGISTEGITLEQEMKFNPETHLISDLEIRINLPAGFPEKYRDAVVNSASLCAVKRHLHNPPAMKVVAVTV
ncbi:MAG TPA: OsmC family protein [Lentimicrobium sp.]|jgi:ribosomal protein S12 methylthiotransferase accessory factor|nr:OsmC family protein [Lentimicrobium sp.]